MGAPVVNDPLSQWENGRTSILFLYNLKKQIRHFLAFIHGLWHCTLISLGVYGVRPCASQDLRVLKLEWMEALPGAGVDNGDCTPLLVSSVFFCLLTWLSGFTDGFSCLYLIYHAQNRWVAPRAPKWNYGPKVAWIMQTASRGWADGGDTISTFSTNSLWNTIWGKNSYSVIIQQEVGPQNWNEYYWKYKFISLLLMSNLTLTICWPIIYSARYLVVILSAFLLYF